MSELDFRRQELRARQGAGARYDAPEAPVDALDLMRRGTAYFARILNGLPDEALFAPVPAWPTRAHLVAMIGFQARSMCATLAAVRRGEPVTGVAYDLEPNWTGIAVAATLPPRALRNLFAHSEVHLNVEFRDLGDADWAVEPKDPAGRPSPVAQMPHRRAVTLWQTSFAMAAGASERDCPPEIMQEVFWKDAHPEVEV
ncbi:maleylpyruvate isomerase N-terminal domain-containing protein [uncultured Nitratireductor sp.]|uniref:maleylpyruvate isomerase N-terminal domain-containing protein n=1 Tax=uncultured Nitratireductor sp. TaxID=520953 RepID=UPI0025FC1739|nr:maleylpyruvate isomerase N-terminal domain-containing protein [uncultured Nitratireductor sp.]